MNKKKNKKIKIAFIFGTRPETIKMYPAIMEATKYPNWIETIIILTAQHREMLDQMINLFKIHPNYDLGIMKHGQSLSQINSQALIKLEKVLKICQPDLVMVQGDTTTTFSAALAAFYQKINVGHIEAGLRTSKKYYPFPEEINRRLTTVLADYHFTPTITTARALLKEGVPKKNVFVTGNTVIDALMLMQKKKIYFNDDKINALLGSDKQILLVTMHRRENWGKPLENLCKALSLLNQKQKDLVIVFPLHKNPIIREMIFNHLSDKENIILTDSLDYKEMAHLMAISTLILTDSGGVQEEAPALGKPLLVLRSETERPEVIKIGAAKLVGTETKNILAEVNKLLSGRDDYQRMITHKSPYGDGQASRRIIEFILYQYHYLDKSPLEFVFKP
ncbi:MAG: non-hydrolyzing UDP-N-acetylglucosamine 2-epimerase [Atribacterota bacterium]